MIQFYAPDIETDPHLPESESQHCVKVLRSRPGDAVEVVDGKGFRYKCTLVDAHPRHAEVAIEERQEVPLCWPCHITIAVAPTKNLDRIEWLTEKLTEVGVNTIVPIKCRYSERKELKLDRLRRVAVAAMKQSLKATMPEIRELTPCLEFIAGCRAEQRFICYCNPQIERKLLAREIKPGRDVAILIGPEGDFSEAEVETAIKVGFVPVTMGDNRLRTETAALVACDTVHIVNQLHS